MLTKYCPIIINYVTPSRTRKKRGTRLEGVDDKHKGKTQLCDGTSPVREFFLIEETE